MPPLRVLVVIPGHVGPNMSGPAIRGWHLAEALAERHVVTVADRRARRASRGDVRLVPSTRRSIAYQAARADVLVSPFLPPFALAINHAVGGISVSDQYDPADLETGALEEDASTAGRIALQRRMLAFQLRFADLVVSAGPRQEARLRAHVERWLPDGHRPVFRQMPFGMSATSASSSERPLRARFPAIGRNDPLVLWWGSIWRWFDAECAIRAFAGVVVERPDARLVLTAARPPLTDTGRYDAAAGARRLAASLGLLDRNVFFLDEWIPYGDRHAYLRDADVGLTLHRATPEAWVAARSRYMDYLSAGTPCVLAQGDDVADEFGRAGFARLVPAGDEGATGDALLALLDGNGACAAARRSAAPLAERYRWGAVTGPIVDAVEAVHRDRAPRSRRAGPTSAAAAGFYARRLGARTRARAGA